MRAEGTHQSRLLPYDETLKPAEAEAAAVALDTILPGVAGTLGVGHPTACEALRVEATGPVRRCCEAPVYVGRFSATGEPSVLLGRLLAVDQRKRVQPDLDVIRAIILCVVQDVHEIGHVEDPRPGKLLARRRDGAHDGSGRGVADRQLRGACEDTWGSLHLRYTGSEAE